MTIYACVFQVLLLQSLFKIRLSRRQNQCFCSMKIKLVITLVGTKRNQRIIINNIIVENLLNYEQEERRKEIA